MSSNTGVSLKFAYYRDSILALNESNILRNHARTLVEMLCQDNSLTYEEWFRLLEMIEFSISPKNK